MIVPATGAGWADAASVISYTLVLRGRFGDGVSPLHFYLSMLDFVLSKTYTTQLWLSLVWDSYGG